MDFFSHPTQALANRKSKEKFLLWIDGVGAYLLCLGDEISLGGPTNHEATNDVALFANLSRSHASLVRSEESYLLKSHAACSVDHRPVGSQACLFDGCEIQLGSSVQLKFRQPSALSLTACLEVVSSHRLMNNADGVILFKDTCLLGSDPTDHIRSRSWTQPTVLFRRANQFFLRTCGRSPQVISLQAERALELYDTQLRLERIPSQSP